MMMSKMIVLNKFVVVKEVAVADTELASGIILSGDITTGNKPAEVVAVGAECEYLVPGINVILDWTKAMPFESEGVKLAVIAYEHVKVILNVD
jgi:co-chaperonin GroES (HSP10)